MNRPNATPDGSIRASGSTCPSVGIALAIGSSWSEPSRRAHESWRTVHSCGRTSCRRTVRHEPRTLTPRGLRQRDTREHPPESLQCNNIQCSVSYLIPMEDAMPRIEITKSLSASVEHVWRAIATPASWENWFMVHASWPEQPPASLSDGAIFVEKIAMMGMTDKVEWEVTEYAELQRLSMSGKSRTGVQVQFSFIITPADEGCRLSVIGNFEDPVLKGPLGKMIERNVGKQVDRSFEQLETLTAAA